MPRKCGSIGGIGTILAAVAAFIAASHGFKQWLGNRQDEQMKRGEERFQKVVEGLGSERTEAKVGAAIMLRTFLQSGYEQFYRQAFDLAVAHLRLRKAEVSAPGPLTRFRGLLRRSSATPTVSIPLDSLGQALVIVFKESFPRARNELEKNSAPFDAQLLDATYVRLDHAYLAGADLAEAWLVRASLREANLMWVQLEGAHLRGPSSKGRTSGGPSSKGRSSTALSSKGRTSGGPSSKGANPEDADSLQDTKLNDVTGLMPEQRETCSKKGALFDEVQ